mgnify:CR=1 FL=1
MYLVQQVTYYLHPLWFNFSSNGHRNGFKHMNCTFRCIECAGAGIQMLDYLRWLGVITSPILNTLHVVLWPIIGILHDILSLNFPSEHNTKKTGIIWADQWESLLDWHLIALLGVGLWLLARDVAWNLKSL